MSILSQLRRNFYKKIEENEARELIREKRRRKAELDAKPLRIRTAKPTEETVPETAVETLYTRFAEQQRKSDEREEAKKLIREKRRREAIKEMVTEKKRRQEEFSNMGLLEDNTRYFMTPAEIAARRAEESKYFYQYDANYESKALGNGQFANRVFAERGRIRMTPAIAKRVRPGDSVVVYNRRGEEVRTVYYNFRPAQVRGRRPGKIFNDRNTVLLNNDRYEVINGFYIADDIPSDPNIKWGPSIFTTIDKLRRRRDGDELSYNLLNNPVGTELLEYDGWQSVKNVEPDDCVYQYIVSLGYAEDSPIAQKAKNIKLEKDFINLCKEYKLSIQIYAPDNTVFFGDENDTHQVKIINSHVYTPVKKIQKAALPELHSTNIEYVPDIWRYIDDKIHSKIIPKFDATYSNVFETRTANDKTNIVRVTQKRPDECEELFNKLSQIHNKNESYSNESIAAISRKYISVGLLYSNPYTDAVMEVLNTKPLTKNFMTSEEYENFDKNNLHKLDCKRCYSTIVREYKLPTSENFINWQVVECNKVTLDGFYYIEHSNSTLEDFFPSNSFVFSTIVRSLLSIPQFAKCVCIRYAVHMKTDYVNLSSISKLDESTQKKLINFFVGNCGTKGYTDIMFLTTSKHEMAHYASELNYYVREYQISDGLNPQLMYEVSFKRKKNFYTHAQHISNAVIQLGRFKLFELRNKVLALDPQAQIIQYVTDSVLFKGAVELTDDLKKSYKVEEIRDYISDYENPGLINKLHRIMSVSNLVPKAWNNKMGGLLLGGGGSGKTTMIMKDPVYSKYELLGATNTAATNIGGVTIDKRLSAVLGFKYDNLPLIKGNFAVDECSMLSNAMLCALATMRANGSDIILMGDFLQALAVGAENFENSPILKYVCMNNKLELTKIYRYDDPTYATRIRAFDFPELPTSSFQRLNICYTHDMEKAIDAKILNAPLRRGHVVNRLEPYYRLELDKRKKINGKTVTCDFIFEKRGDLLHQCFSAAKIVIPYSKAFRKTHSINISRCQGLTIDVPHALFELDHKHYSDNLKYVAYSRCTNTNLVTFGEVEGLKVKRTRKHTIDIDVDDEPDVDIDVDDEPNVDNYDNDEPDYENYDDDPDVIQLI